MKQVLLSLAVTGLLFTGCSQDNATQTQQSAQKQMPPMPVQAFEVTLAKATFSKSYAALLKPFQEVEVVARINGILEKENFIEGSYVTKGDVLYEIQKNEYKAALETAEATQAKAQANFDKATKDFQRAEYLYKNKAISQQQFDEFLYAYDDAKATLQGAKASVDIARIEYGYTTIRAPISGLIGISKSDEGSYIATQNATLTSITALDPVYAEFSLPNNDVMRYRSQIKTGSKVIMEQDGKTYVGEVDYIAPKLDSQTDTLLVRAKFANASKELVIGSFMQVRLDGFSYENVATIPQNALLKTPDAILVYVINEDGSLGMRPVEVAHVKEGNAIILGGLQAGEKIVVSNIAKLRPSSKVTIIGGN
jgi:membrane fusion protein (multidrug efflux system)